MKYRAVIIAVLFGAAPPYAAAADWNALPAGVPGLTRTAPAVSAPERVRTLVCVDAGHPNTFSAGTSPVNGTNETHINWLVALELERLLKEKGFEVLMTKSAELQYVENKDRALLCNGGGAALAVHLHCESTPGSGFALYYPDRQGTFEYNDDPDNGFKGPSPQVRADSRTLAAAVQKGMKAVLAGILPDRGLYGDSRTAVGSSQGALTFSIFSKIPTATIEMAVLTNKNDAAYMKTEAGQRKMAQAIAAGILNYKNP